MVAPSRPEIRAGRCRTAWHARASRRSLDSSPRSGSTATSTSQPRASPPMCRRSRRSNASGGGRGERSHGDSRRVARPRARRSRRDRRPDRARAVARGEDVLVSVGMGDGVSGPSIVGGLSGSAARRGERGDGGASHSPADGRVARGRDRRRVSRGAPWRGRAARDARVCEQRRVAPQQGGSAPPRRGTAPDADDDVVAQTRTPRQRTRSHLRLHEAAATGGVADHP